MTNIVNHQHNKKDIELKDNYQPLEYIHWCAMGDEFVYIVEHILKKYPEYAHYLTTNNENGAFIAAYNNSVQLLMVIEKYAPLSIRHISPYGNILHVCIENNSNEAWKYLISLENMNYDAFCNDGTNLFLSICHAGDSDKFNDLSNVTNIDFKVLDKLGNRSALYFIIDHYIKHQNNYLFEIILAEYNISMLQHKDVMGLNVLDFLYHKINNQSSSIQRIFAPLEFSLKNEFFSYGIEL